MMLCIKSHRLSVTTASNGTLAGMYSGAGAKKHTMLCFAFVNCQLLEASPAIGCPFVRFALRLRLV
jgi:hypothetical protein